MKQTGFCVLQNFIHTFEIVIRTRTMESIFHEKVKRSFLKLYMYIEIFE